MAAAAAAIGIGASAGQPSLHSGPPKGRPRRVTVEPSYTTQHATNGDRECARRIRQGAHHLQRLSHPPGTVQPRHIFGGLDA